MPSGCMPTITRKSLALIGNAFLLFGVLCAENRALAQSDALEAPDSRPATTASTTEFWAGKVTVFGYRRVPIIGKVDFQTSNHVLATVERRGDDVFISQQVCAHTC